MYKCKKCKKELKKGDHFYHYKDPIHFKKTVQICEECLKNTIREVSRELSTLDRKEFKKLLEKHKDGDIAKIIEEINNEKI